MRRTFALLMLLLPGWAPAQEPVRIVGGPGGGCIQGAIELPAQGPGFETIRMSRSWFWGAPSTIAALELLAIRARDAGLGELYMNDISRPRGGPFPGIHASHMLGLDADVWLDTRPKPRLDRAGREAVEVQSLVRPDGRGIEPANWSRQQIELLHLAATLPGLDRILVNAAIKKQLCLDVQGDRSWLHLVRPWYGHAAHMHLHFRCPPGQAECVDQAPPPANEACDATLQWWFDQLDAPPAKPSGPAKPVVLPAACTAIMAAPAR